MRRTHVTLLLGARMRKVLCVFLIFLFVAGSIFLPAPQAAHAAEGMTVGSNIECVGSDAGALIDHFLAER